MLLCLIFLLLLDILFDKKKDKDLYFLQVILKFDNIIIIYNCFCEFFYHFKRFIPQVTAFHISPQYFTRYWRTLATRCLFKFLFSSRNSTNLPLSRGRYKIAGKDWRASCKASSSQETGRNMKKIKVARRDPVRKKKSSVLSLDVYSVNYYQLKNRNTHIPPAS